MIVTETRAELSLQGLLDHSAKRLVAVQEEVVNRLVLTGVNELICKWGCDLCSGHSRYKQKSENSDANDEFLFVLSLVPIKMHPINDPKIYAWQN